MEGRCSTNAFNEQSKVTITDDDDIQSGSEECKESADDSYQTSGLQSSKRRRLDIDSDSEEEVELTKKRSTSNKTSNNYDKTQISIYCMAKTPSIYKI